MRMLPLFALLLACPGSGPDEGDGSDEPVDSDGDGLLDDEEATLGTDPSAADSDGDGWNDGDELDAGTNPTFLPSHPFEQGDYLVGSCPVLPDEANGGPTGTGSYSGQTWDAYQEGDILLNFDNSDTFEQAITPYAFCGNYTLITQSAIWCPPCQALAAEMAEDMAKVQESYPNFTMYEFLIEDISGHHPDAEELTEWKDEYELYGIPVVGPIKGEDAPHELWLNPAGGIPSTLLVAPDMTVIWSGVDHGGAYLTSAREIKDAIEEYEASNL